LAFYGVLSLSVKADFKLAVVGKTFNDSFYQQSFKGCQDYAKTVSGLQCVYAGPRDYQDIRSQSFIVNDLVEQGIDGLLISTTDSDFLVKNSLQKLKNRNIPLITFDSDLLPEHKQYRLAYVGTNNFDFGQALGTYVREKFANMKREYCLLSGHQTTPNLNNRIAGVKQALNDWLEHPRCPLYSLGKREMALNQLRIMLQQETPPIIIAVAGFAQFHPQYVAQMAPYKDKIESGNIVIVSADTEDIQLKAIRAGLSTANIGQRPYEMGRLSSEMMYHYLKTQKKPKSDKVYLGYHYCNKGNVETCTINH
jgi:ribose transport system substrate-binding protein